MEIRVSSSHRRQQTTRSALSVTADVCYDDASKHMCFGVPHRAPRRRRCGGGGLRQAEAAPRRPRRAPQGAPSLAPYAATPGDDAE